MQYNKEKWDKFLKKARKRRDAKGKKHKKKYKKYEKKFRNGLNIFKKEHAEELVKYSKRYDFSTEKEFADKLYEEISADEIDRKLEKCKVMVITANPIEKAILHYEMAKGNLQKIKVIIHNDISYYVFEWGKYTVLHIHQLNCGADTEFGTSFVLNEALHHCNPHVIISLGVAFGIDPWNQRIGEVIVSERILPYNANKRKENKIIAIRNQDKRVDKWLYQRLSSVPGFMDGVYMGDILTGGSVLSSFEEKDRICCAYTETDFLVGGEMEGTALFTEANFKRVPGVVIKGICDWGVIKNEEDCKKEKKTKGEGSPGESGYPLTNSVFKHGAQAYAMTKAIEKCGLLFNNQYLFSESKYEALQKLISERSGYHATLVRWRIKVIICSIVFMMILPVEYYMLLNQKNITYLLVSALVSLFIVYLAFFLTELGRGQELNPEVNYFEMDWNYAEYLKKNNDDGKR